MFEIEINGVPYGFKFGLGFAREINKTKQMTGENGEKVDAGLNYAVASLIDENLVELVDILLLANKTEKVRVSKADLEAYLEDNDTDVDELFKNLLDFFENNNSTKKAVETIKKLIEVQKTKAEKGE